jgi:signal transduction histidine kinase
MCSSSSSVEPPVERDQVHPAGRAHQDRNWLDYERRSYAAVRDSGPGIPEDEIPRIMSSFGRGRLAQKNAEEGSGLGLPIELHGGTFTLKSKLRGHRSHRDLPARRDDERIARDGEYLSTI